VCQEATQSCGSYRTLHFGVGRVFLFSKPYTGLRLIVLVKFTGTHVVQLVTFTHGIIYCLPKNIVPGTGTRPRTWYCQGTRTVKFTRPPGVQGILNSHVEQLEFLERLVDHRHQTYQAKETLGRAAFAGEREQR
jgi:hypothetical protein